jgi:hypothetical protein
VLEVHVVDDGEVVVDHEQVGVLELVDEELGLPASGMGMEARAC